MEAVFVKKIYNINLFTIENLPLILDKFALKTFNCLAYDYEISGVLVASYFLGLANYYILSNNVKSIDLRMI